MNEKIKISSILIAKNEERNIKACIESQLNCIDDIVVIVDSKSEDKTLDIVKSFGNRVNYEVCDWLGFAKTKIYAVSKTKHEWVFWIDADEVIRSELAEEINSLKYKYLDESAFSVARRAYFLGRWIKHSGWYPARVLRLFNKNKAKFVEREVHEHLEVDGKIGNLKNDLDHFTDPDIHHYLEKFNRYTTLAAQELKEKNKSISIFGLFFRPFFMFIKMYFLKLGFLDGIQGFILSCFSSAYVFTKYSKLWELKRGNVK